MPTGEFLALAEVWNGSGWTVLSTPNPTVGANQLLRVSCATTTSCVAIGAGGSGSPPFFEQWNGQKWALTPGLVAKSLFPLISDVSCSSPASCLAIGNDYPRNIQQPLAEYWNGRAWKVVSVPVPRGAHGGSFNAVSCMGKGGCIATGTYLTAGGANDGLAESWSGGRWSLLPGPLAPGGS